MYQLKFTYDVILGMRYELVPMDTVDLLPRAIFKPSELSGAKFMQRANNGKNR